MLARPTRHRTLAAHALTAVALVLLGACGGGGASSPSTSSPPPRTGGSSAAAAPPAASVPEGHAVGAPTLPACRSAAQLVCVTDADEGRTVTLALGARLLLDLSAPGRVWSVPQQSNAPVLAELGLRRREGGALEVLYGAEHAGTTTLSASERPVCARGRVCPLFIVLWRLRVHVRGA